MTNHRLAEDYRQAAAATWGATDEVDIDADPVVSISHDPDEDREGGAWVQAWVYVSRDDMLNVAHGFALMHRHGVCSSCGEEPAATEGRCEFCALSLEKFRENFGEVAR